MTFSELGLSERVLKAVEGAGYVQPTPIQAQAIPHVMQKRDVLGIAQTGTGKTAAFTLPMLSLLESGRARARMPRTLILEPTRELAAQVEDSFAKYGVNHKLSVALLIGGVSFGDQDAKITRGVDVLIATPGRLLDHFERGKLLLTGIEVLVIDEADRMLDMGFIPDIERICKLVPFTRQTLFFSATMPPEITRLTEAFLHNPVRVEVSRPASTAQTITQSLVASGGKDYEKREVLRGLIKNAEGLKNAIIFCNRKKEVGVLHRSLLKYGFEAVALHGDMDQRARLAALDSFKNGEAKLLVASDVAARGLDIPDVSHVFNYDTPHHAEDYVHRIGRTGRAGRQGSSVTIVTPIDDKSLAAIEKLIGQKIEWTGEPVEDAPRRSREDRGDRRHGGRHEAGRKPSGRDRRDSGEARKEPADHHRRAAGRPQQAAPAPRPPRYAEEHEPRRSHDHDASDARVVGMGDHVPSFLLRPVRRSG
ncbi:DEAD/DEAH box helicase [Terrarubrum flagellatum]|uniref:DEAD/DEAH box helicase n=1 Tax=Terrirubrum flagellatum TaxID=2895980 RepID=UPI00314565FA